MDWSFYSHVWEQTLYRGAQEAYLSGIEPLAQRWNEAPQRLAMFSIDEKVRPQYFVYQMLTHMGEERISAHTDNQDLRVLATRSAAQVSVMLTNYNLQESNDRVITLRFSPLTPGTKMLTTYRIDEQHRWDAHHLELQPLERRAIDVTAQFQTQLFCPADSVTFMTMEDL